MLRETFTDSETGREIESTWLARGAGLLIGFYCRDPVAGVLFFIGVLPVLACTTTALLAYWCGVYLAGAVGVLLGLAAVIANGASLPAAYFYRNKKSMEEKIHLAVARWQDQRREARRQRRNQERMYPHVPDGAISRARPHGKPEPTRVSLSRADAPEDLPRLSAAVEDTTQDHLRGGLEVYETVSVSA